MVHNDDDDEIVVQVKLIRLSWHNKSEDMGNYDQRMSRMSVKSLQHVTLLAFCSIRYGTVQSRIPPRADNFFIHF